MELGHPESQKPRCWIWSSNAPEYAYRSESNGLIVAPSVNMNWKIIENMTLKHDGLNVSIYGCIWAFEESFPTFPKRNIVAKLAASASQDV